MSNTNGHKVPLEEQRPAEDPPPYEAVIQGSPQAGTPLNSSQPGPSSSSQTARPQSTRPSTGRPEYAKCEKCGGTGIRRGKRCKYCEGTALKPQPRPAPQRQPPQQYGGYGGYGGPGGYGGQGGYGGPPMGPIIPMGPAQVVRPRVVRPGHPSIGGVLCDSCRGSGIVTELLIFESVCPMCNGLGRVFPQNRWRPV